MHPLLSLLRPRQWIKGGFVIAPIIFARHFDNPVAWQNILIAALAFTLTASTAYIINDLMDRTEDAMHPTKRLRPLASRQVSVGAATMLALLCIALTGLLCLSLPEPCIWIIATYALANLAYTLRLKHEALVDVLMIGVFFVMRVLMGCFALAVMVSPWIILTTFMLALFLGFAKRYHEMGLAEYAHHKKNLARYHRDLLDRLMTISATAALVCYAIYTAEVSHAGNLHTMMYTVPFVAFGLFRYLQTVHVDGLGGEPESVMLRDRGQWVNMALWLAVTLWALS